MAAFDPSQPSYLFDPYPALAALRAEDPVWFSADLEAWVVTGYAECSAVLHDASTYRSDFLAVEGARWDEARRRSEVFLGGVPALSAMAEPDHHRMRDTVSGAFSPRAVERLRPRIETIINALLDVIEPGRPFDVMGGLAYPLPRHVIAAQLGLADAERDAFLRDASTIARGIFGSGTAEEVAQAHEARASIAAYLARAASTPDTYDVTGALHHMFEARDSSALSEVEVLALMMDVALAGNDPTACLIGNGTLALLRHPEERAALLDDPARIPSAVEELLRYDSPLHALMRIAGRDTTLGGHEVRAGDVVYLMLGAANRDPAQFEEPDRLDVRREHPRHLAFGAGSHHCLGAPLARLTAEVAFTSMLARFPSMRLAPLGLEREPEFELRGPSRLLVLTD